MKRKNVIIVFIICLLILAISPYLHIYYNEYTLKKELKAAIKDYAQIYCNKEVKVRSIDISNSLFSPSWKAELEPEDNYLSGEIYEGKVKLSNSPCTEHEGFILLREKQKFIKFYNYLDIPDYGEANSFNNYRHPAYAIIYFPLLGVCLILIIILLIIYFKLYQKEKREKGKE